MIKITRKVGSDTRYDTSFDDTVLTLEHIKDLLYELMNAPAHTHTIISSKTRVDIEINGYTRNVHYSITDTGY